MMAFRRLTTFFEVSVLIFLVLTGSALQCGPGRGSPGRHRRPRKMTPLVFKQHVPNVSEDTIGASGAPEGPISRKDSRFKDLVRNDNPNIIFRDEEGTKADRYMSKRCKEMLNRLAISVENQWQGVKLRVTESWDEDHTHSKDSLHYEGRAVDITTSDRDKTKYGMLARLAVEAGFDWVYYQSRGHIHCSVKSDNSAATTGGGCFHGSMNVTLSTGTTKLMSELEIGDKVLSVDSEGHLDYSEVITFLDRQQTKRVKYFKIETDIGQSLTMTPSHLLFVSQSQNQNLNSINRKAIFARDTKIGQYIYFTNSSMSTVKPAKIVKITSSWREGLYAPLTKHGTIVVNNVVASCYGITNNENIAHMALAPLRAYHYVSNSVLKYFQKPEQKGQSTPEGIHWYAKLLYNISPFVVKKDLLFQEL